MRDEMKSTLQDQQNQLGTKLENLKQYWSAEQDKREVTQKQEEKLKDLAQKKQRLEWEREQNRAQAERDEELLRRFTAALVTVTTQGTKISPIFEIW